MQNKDKGDGIEDSPLDMLLVILLEGASKEVVTPSSEAMPISKEDDTSLWEQYHIILLSPIVLYWIWSLLYSDTSLVVTRVSPPIFGLQHCCRFRNQMQLNMGGLRLKTLFLYFLFHHLYLYFLFFFFNFPSFYNLYFFFFYFLLQRVLILHFMVS